MKKFSWALAASLVLALVVRPALADDVDKAAIRKADGFLKTAKRGQFIGGFCHFGVAYRGHSAAGVRLVKNAAGGLVAGHFALVYDFKMSDGVETQLAFLCDAKGNVYRAQVMSSNGIIQKPYGLANVSIKLLGEAVYEAMKDNLAEGDRRVFRRLVDAADAEGLMLFCLKVQQASE